MRIKTLGPLAIATLLLGGSQVVYAAFNLGGGENYALIFQGGLNTLQITTATAGGNVGIAGTGKATDIGPSTINGAVNFAVSNTGQWQNTNSANVITGGTNFSVSTVQDSMNWLNNLSQTLYGDHGTNIAITSNDAGTHNQTINASDGTTFTINGQTVHVFDATSFLNSSGNTLTINGSATDLVAINLDGIGNIQLLGSIKFTGGITADNVLFNLGGGDYTAKTGAASLTLSNGSGQTGVAQGIFLDPNGAISVVNAVIQGRVFGGVQYVSGANLTVPSASDPVSAPVPDTGATATFFGLAFAGMGGLHRILRRKPQKIAVIGDSG